MASDDVEEDRVALLSGDALESADDELLVDAAAQPSTAAAAATSTGDDDGDGGNGARECADGDAEAGSGDSSGGGSDSGGGNNNTNNDEEDEEDDATPEEHAEVVTAILWPVAITMCLVIWFIKSGQRPNAPPQFSSLEMIMAYHEHARDSTVDKLKGSLKNMAEIVGAVLVVTCVMVALFYFRCMKIIWGWLFFSVVSLLFYFGGTMALRLLVTYELDVDVITYAVLLTNFAVIGVLSLFYSVPQKLNQFYLIIISVVLAVFLSKLPEWTTFVALVGMSIYDLFAVLCPKGPLRLLLQIAQERQEPIPALLYSGMAYHEDDDGVPMLNEPAVATTTTTTTTTMTTTNSRESSRTGGDSSSSGSDSSGSSGSGSSSGGGGGGGGDGGSTAEPSSYVSFGDVDSPLSSPEGERGAGDDANDGSDDANADGTDAHRRLDAEEVAARLRDEMEQRKSSGVKLGLGDFVFYSVLIGRAAMYDILTVFTCFMAIISGLFMTLVCLAVFKKALPALPFSIFMGIIFYLLTRYFLLPFVLAFGRAGVVV